MACFFIRAERSRSKIAKKPFDCAQGEVVSEKGNFHEEITRTRFGDSI